MNVSTLWNLYGGVLFVLLVLAAVLIGVALGAVLS